MATRSPSRPSCTGVILAGGGASRFGGAAKGLVTIGGRRIVDRLLDALAPVCDSVLVLAKQPEALHAALVGVRVERDARPEQASLVGVHGALSAVEDAALIVAWDMPFVPSALLRALRALGERAECAALPEGPRGLEPLCAYYPRRCLATAEAQLAAGNYRMASFVEALAPYARMPLHDVAAFGDPATIFANINSLADLRAADQRACQGNGERRPWVEQEPA